jgi:hypothetical protein
MPSRSLRLARLLLAAGPSRRKFLKTGLGVTMGGPNLGILNKILSGQINPKTSLLELGSRMGKIRNNLWVTGSKGGKLDTVASWSIERNYQDEVVLNLFLAAPNFHEGEQLIPDEQGRLRSQSKYPSSLAQGIEGATIDELPALLDAWLGTTMKQTVMSKSGFSSEVINRISNSPRILTQLFKKLGYGSVEQKGENWDPSHHLLWTQEQKEQQRVKWHSEIKKQQEMRKDQENFNDEDRPAEQLPSRRNQPTFSVHDDFNETHGPLFWEPGSSSTWSSR